MSEQHKATLQRANAAITAGDHEGFLACCHDDVVWTTVGEGSLRGKAAVRQWMQENYLEPPQFTVTRLIAEDDHVVALGTIEVVTDGVATTHAYCDVWRFRDGRMAELRAFVIPESTTDP
jgi:ketosteroid isomerase-like protein